MRIAVDLINLSSSALLDGNLRDFGQGKIFFMFGCRACVHIPKDERLKLDDKDKECIL